MPKLKDIDRTAARMIGAKALTALEKALKEFGLTVTQGNSRYGQGSVTMKFEASIPADKSDKQERDSNRIGFDRNLVGLYFTIPGKRSRYEIVDVRTSRPKYPITAVTQRGARYKFGAEQVARYLGKSVKWTRPLW